MACPLYGMSAIKRLQCIKKVLIYFLTILEAHHCLSYSYLLFIIIVIAFIIIMSNLFSFGSVNTDFAPI